MPKVTIFDPMRCCFKATREGAKINLRFFFLHSGFLFWHFRWQHSKLLGKIVVSFQGLLWCGVWEQVECSFPLQFQT